VVVARVAGIAGLGAFSLVYAGWLGTAAMHRALITDPMAIEGDLRKPDAKMHVGAGLAAEMVLVSRGRPSSPLSVSSSSPPGSPIWVCHSSP